MVATMPVLRRHSTTPLTQTSSSSATCGRMKQKRTPTRRSSASAACAAGSRIEMFASMIPMCVGMSLLPFTAQNHGYAVDPAILPRGVDVTHTNLNDGTCEGFVDPERRLFAVQFHPEASPGPHDAHHLFDDFRLLAADGDVLAACGGAR